MYKKKTFCSLIINEIRPTFTKLTEDLKSMVNVKTLTCILSSFISFEWDPQQQHLKYRKNPAKFAFKNNLNFNLYEHYALAS